MIHARNLTKVLRDGSIESTILQNVNLDIEQGEYVVILGPSGSGKSTLINIIGLIEMPTSGELFFMGHEVSRLKDRQRSNLRRGGIGFIFQNFGLIDELNVYENIELPLKYLKYSKRERQDKVANILSKLQVSHLKHYFPKQLSALQKQLVGVGRAIITNPDLIVADEPTGNLTSACGNKIMEVLSSLNEEGFTIVMATHSALEADRGQRVIQLFDGHVVTENIKNRL
ncbi:ABC transporter ATP-binding protein [Carboxylicivirga sediminis]|uniref:ABC transporter ATP-binding protein n=1 Tax=Carboxylicivirga sediminis TaxID=2006564 RepID=A0A941F5E0_9BACT|nr:ABC transporter ATP-binding protein [Carboxylicivirga sediminis]MBR8536767.1 ABC transporter ATP-binding protein [Carboxylicivirga sediminis]